MPLTLLVDRQYTAPSAADNVSITPSGVAWTNSAYVTVLDPTPAACVLTGVVVFTTEGSASSPNYDAEIDIATGTAGAEVVIATVRARNTRVSTSTTTGGVTHCLVLPIPVDAIGSGVRVAARLRKNSTTLTTWTVAVTYLRKPLASAILTTASAPKTLPSAAAGVTVTAGGSAWANGTWGQLRAASGAALVVLGVVLGAPSSANSDYELDLGTGGAGTEVVVTTLRFSPRSSETLPAVLMLPIPLDNVAAAARLAARLRCSTASATTIVSLMVVEKPL